MKRLSEKAVSFLYGNVCSGISTKGAKSGGKPGFLTCECDHERKLL